jgi:ApaG protein
MAADLYKSTTKNIEISVMVMFLEDESSAEDDHYMWAYIIKIKNKGRERVHLKRRFWRIIDQTGVVNEVAGEGVVGEQPIIDPGETYEYTSAVPLNSPSGLMGGYYEMEKNTGDTFQVTIPTFSLDSPYESIVIN